MLVFTHAPLQSVPLEQTQLPAEQYCPLGQARPQPPQLELLVLVSTHPPLQSVPLEHTHVPAEQDCPLGQARPHPPQLELLVLTSTQAPLQSVPLEHAHAPLEQTCPSPHAPHVKQPDGEEPQEREPQSLEIDGCVQTPEAQTSCVQAFPSLEQAMLPTTGTHVEPLKT